ncbi:hypothetical protein BGX26_000177 [Mortierella sp. AD094]|nr:hypothetical protein BGX26_000177 [Mortierella sp. AD094]
MASSPMDLPEIRTHLGFFLDIDDVLQCILVCQAWRRSFEPLLYHLLTSDSFYNYNQKKHWPPLDRLLQLGTHQTTYASHVRSLSIDCEIQAQYLKPAYNQLVYLDLIWPNPSSSDFDDHKACLYHQPDQVNKFFRRHHGRLKHILIDGSVSLQAQSWQHLADKSLFPKWTKLTVIHKQTFDQETLDAFWTACSRLQFLQLIGVESLTPPSLEFPHLELLALDCLPEWSVMDELQMIDRCPQLDCLFWYPSTYVEEVSDIGQSPAGTNLDQIPIAMVQGLERLATSGRLQKLRKLVLYLRAKDTAPFTTPELQKYTAALLDSLVMPLASFDIQWRDFDANIILPSLQRHFATLSFLNLTISLSGSSRMVQTIMTSCPLLENFTGNVVRALDMMEGEPWVCLGITNLRVQIEVDPEIDTPGRSKQDQQQFVLIQLSKLTRLEILDLRGRCSLQEEWEDQGILCEILHEKTARRDKNYRLDLPNCAGLGILNSLTRLTEIYYT